MLNMGTLCEEAEDHLLWRGDPKGIFSVKSAYSIMANHQHSGIKEKVFL